VPVDVPDFEIDTNASRGTPQPHFYAANILAAVQFQVAYVGGVNATYKLVVLLLQLSDGPR
jgi:hypothetical protein